MSRRELLASAAGAAAFALVPDQLRAERAAEPSVPPPVGLRVVFQGDSITDAGRARAVAAPNDGTALGTGYPLLVASAVLRAYPAQRLQFYNRGVSGNKVPDLQARWDADTVALRPGLVSVLIGVNDLWHAITLGYTGTVADYESQYDALLGATSRALPDARVVVVEPFVLRTGAVTAQWFPEFTHRQQVAARVAQRHRATFVPLQEAFDAGAREVGPAYWASDGVHPTPAGQALIAEQWRKTVGL